MDKSLADTFWVLVCAAQVFLMQAGFLCMESGLTRNKNNVNVAIKNLTDLGIAVLLFWAVGYRFMFGESLNGWIGTMSFSSGSGSEGAWHTSFLLFEIMFCTTVATILSGAVAERMRFVGYILVTLLVVSIIYPVFGHWAWNGINLGTRTGWLGNRGFVDFAGSTVVHSVGGWVALAAILVIGPRSGRFPKDGPPKAFHGANLPMAVLGVTLLWFGWFGFNGGSTLALTDAVPGILLNTLLGGASGMLAAMAAGAMIQRRTDVRSLIIGVLAGLVSVTASCHAVSMSAAAFIGGMGGIVALAVDLLLERFRIDDAVGAVPVHLGAGIWGTLAVAVFGRPEYLDTGLGRLPQLQVQILGILVCFGWAFGVSYLILKAVNRFYPLRVTAESERIGLNVAEHGAPSELMDLLTVMDRQSKTEDLSLRASEDPYTEIGLVAIRYNEVMRALGQAEAGLQKAHSELVRKERLAVLGRLTGAVSHDLRNPLGTIRNALFSTRDALESNDASRADRSLQLAERNIQRCDNIVSELLNYARRPVLSPELTDLDEWLGGVLDEQEIPSGQVCVREFQAATRVSVDREHLRRAVVNVITNAVQALQEVNSNGNRLRVETRVTGSRLEMRFVDNGPGIKKDDLEQIFEPLFSTKSVGVGLGVPIIKSIMEEHGGGVRYESEVGRGTTATLWLPIQASGE